MLRSALEVNGYPRVLARTILVLFDHEHRLSNADFLSNVHPGFEDFKDVRLSVACSR